MSRPEPAVTPYIVHAHQLAGRLQFFLSLLTQLFGQNSFFTIPFGQNSLLMLCPLFSGPEQYSRLIYSHLPLAPNIVRKGRFSDSAYPMAQSSVELRQLNAGTSNHNTEPQDTLRTSSDPQTTNVEFSLPPVDTGKEAWLFLAACWMVEALTFGRILPKLRSVSFIDLLRHK
jgi:hypothetical protein